MASRKYSAKIDSKKCMLSTWWDVTDHERERYLGSFKPCSIDEKIALAGIKLEIAAGSLCYAMEQKERRIVHNGGCCSAFLYGDGLASTIDPKTLRSCPVSGHIRRDMYYAKGHWNDRKDREITCLIGRAKDLVDEILPSLAHKHFDDWYNGLEYFRKMLYEIKSGALKTYRYSD